MQWMSPEMIFFGSNEVTTEPVMSVESVIRAYGFAMSFTDR